MVPNIFKTNFHIPNEPNIITQAITYVTSIFFISAFSSIPANMNFIKLPAAFIAVSSPSDNVLSVLSLSSLSGAL